MTRRNENLIIGGLYGIAAVILVVVGMAVWPVVKGWLG
jgi:hypothetical protein